MNICMTQFMNELIIMFWCVMLHGKARRAVQYLVRRQKKARNPILTNVCWSKKSWSGQQRPSRRRHRPSRPSPPLSPLPSAPPYMEFDGNFEEDDGPHALPGEVPTLESLALKALAHAVHEHEPTQISILPYGGGVALLRQLATSKLVKRFRICAFRPPASL